MRRREFIAVLNPRVLAVGLAAFAIFGTFDSATAAEPRCTCRAFGRSFGLDQSVCLPTSRGPRIAVCVMVLNMTSWQISDTPCVGARMRNEWRATTLTVPQMLLARADEVIE
jgi:hypothetical protein